VSRRKYSVDAGSRVTPAPWAEWAGQRSILLILGLLRSLVAPRYLMVGGARVLPRYVGELDAVEPRQDAPSGPMQRFVA